MGTQVSQRIIGLASSVRDDGEKKHKGDQSKVKPQTKCRTVTLKIKRNESGTREPRSARARAMLRHTTQKIALT